jgi:hypothetical protein
MLTIVLRMLGVTLLDMTINTDGEPEQQTDRPDLDGRSIGFEVRTDTTNLPSLEDG